MDKGNCIILIDDNEIDNVINLGLIKELSMFNRIEIATDGKKALEKIAELFLEGIHPSLILLDINMPNMDGFQFLEAYNNLKHIVRCPVIMLSSSPLLIDKEKALIFRASGYYLKPLTIDKLNRIIEIHLV